MVTSPRKTGLPRALEAQRLQEAEELEERGPFDPSTLEDFLSQEFTDGTANQQDGLPSVDWLKSKFKTKSAAIRYLVHELETPPAKVAKHLGVRYQQVRNVTKKELKRGPNEDFKIGPYDKDES